MSNWTPERHPMKRERHPAHITEDLRGRAERFLAEAGPDREKIAVEDVQRMVHELQVHQTELDMQNQELRRAQEAIEEARSRYEALYDSAPVGYFILSRKGKIIQVNLTGAGLLGVKRSFLIDQPFHLRLAPEFREAFRAHLQKVFETGGQQTCELKILRPDGTHLHVLMESTTQPDAAEAQRQCHAVISDITARMQAAKELNLKERLLDGASDSIFLHDLDGHFLYLNEAAYKDRGYEKEELLAQNLSVLPTPEFASKRGSLLNDLMDKGEILFESAHLRKDGSVLPVEIHARTIDHGGQKLILSAARDITERKQAEEALIKSEATLSTILKASPTGIGLVVDRAFQWVNERLLSMTGYSREELIGRSSRIFYPSEAEFKRVGEVKYRQIIKDGWAQIDTQWQRKDGSLIEVYLSSVALDPDNLSAGVVFAATDITERKRAAEELRSAAQKWRTTFDAIGDAVCLMDSEAKILTCNQAMADLVGRPFPEIIGRYCWDLVHGTDGPIDGCPLVRMKQSGKRETLILPLGERWLHAIVDPILNEAGEITGAVHSIVDITEHRRALEQIKHLNVILTAIKNMNETLLRVKSEPELFQHICDLMLDIPHNRFTWIGLVEPGSFEVKPVAWAGHEDGYLSVIKVTWDDSPHGRGPIGMAIKTGQPIIVDDIENDSRFRPWRQPALQRGYVSCIAFPLIHEGKALGSLNVYAEKKQVFQAEELGFLKQVAGDIAVGVRSLRQEQELVQGVIQLQIMIHQTVETMASIVETRDPYTAGHQKGVAQLAGAIAAEMSLDADRLQGLRVAGLLHDIGKMVVPAEILSKPGKLSETEFNLIKAHSQAGADILGKINFPWPVAQIVLQHHERLDGSGYPQGLAAKDILLEARILAVADVMEAMASHRPYRPALGIDKALEEISKNKETLYDGEVVAACVKLFAENGFHFD
jgi:PAS domain S-box-containing protein/putative nucleotidyltransferase with HDIG domain